MELKNKASIGLITVLSMAISAAADITTDISNFTTIIGNSTYGFTGFFVSMMGVFMQPPLVYFVVLGIFITFIHLVASFLIKRGKK